MTTQTDKPTNVFLTCSVHLSPHLQGESGAWSKSRRILVGWVLQPTVFRYGWGTYDRDTGYFELKVMYPITLKINRGLTRVSVELL